MAKGTRFPADRPSRLAVDHRDHALLTKLELAIHRHAGGQTRFEIDIPLLLRQAIDEVIDTARSGRFLLEELQNSEKTYIGTKVEIILRTHLKLERGTRLDVIIDGIETDIKNTIGTSWMIPPEAINHPCIIIRTDEKKSKCWFGLVIAHQDILNPGGNQDKKTTIAAEHFVNVLWLLYAHGYPRNFWEDVDITLRNEFMKLKSGNKRLVSFFKHFVGRPIARHVITSLVPQRDTLKRLRKNGGARDQLGREGVALLSGAYNSEVIAALHLPYCTQSEFISVIPKDDSELALLRRHRCLPETS
jgi:hypothetical protein